VVTLADNRYGKSLVRLARVKRLATRHEFREWTLQILLQGDFESCFTEGDNSKILPTDTMKNAVYSVARNSSAESMEAFAKELIDFLLSRNPQASRAEVSVSERNWEPLTISGKSHPTAFVQASDELQTARASRGGGAKFSIEAGLENLVILKTADSGFEGYIHDSLTTLPETSDRLLGTTLRANWTYESADLDFSAKRTAVRDTLLATFAGHVSKSVQHTLYAMGRAVLEKVSGVEDIELVMPNNHYFPADLSRFGQDNPNEIFVPTGEPRGYIEARIRRRP
jgi:urate oxidase